MSEPALAIEPRRALSLDAVRGLAILLMCLSGVIPEGLPNFMYHGYYPRYLPDAAGAMQQIADPHTHRWQWSSFTWVDWVFPMFLFAMGAAFPLALGRSLDKGVSAWRLVPAVLGRGLTLVAFAVYVQQVTPATIQNPPTASTQCLGLLGFALLFPVLTRLPRRWGAVSVRSVRSVGVALAVAFVIYLNLNDGEPFSFAQNNIILLLLAHMAIAGSIIWLVSRNRMWLRLAFLLLVFIAHDKAMYNADDPMRDTLLGGTPWLDPLVNWPDRLLDMRWLADLLPGFLGRIPAGVLDLSPLYDFTWYKFLFIVIPGTIVGDLLRDWMRSPLIDKDTRSGGWSSMRYAALHLLITLTIIWVFVCTHGFGRVLELPARRLLLWPIWLGVAPMLICALLLLRGAGTPTQRLLRSLTRWGGFWLALGLVVEPFEVGLTKGPPVPLSYYFVALGLSVLLLAAMTVWIDVFRLPASLYVLNGQNPMLAYVGIRNLLAPLVALPLLAPLGIDAVSLNEFVRGLLPATPWMQLIWAVAQTLTLGAIVMAFTRLRVVWRS